METKLTEKMAEKIIRSKVIASDVDGTLVPSVALAAPSLIRQELRNGRYLSAAAELLGGMLIYSGFELQRPFRNALDTENWALSNYHKLLRVSGVKKEVLQGVMRRFVEAREYSGAGDAIAALRSTGAEKKMLVLVSTGASVNVEVLQQRYSADSIICNETHYDDKERIRYVSVKIGTSIDKLKFLKDKLDWHGIRLKDVVYLGNSMEDLPFKDRVALFIAAPSSERRIGELADLHPASFTELVKELNRRSISK